MHTSASLAASLPLMVCLSMGLAAQRRSEAVDAPPAGSPSALHFDAPAPTPVTAAEQAALGAPRQADRPPTAGEMMPTNLSAGGSLGAARPFPWVGKLAASDPFPRLGGPNSGGSGSGSGAQPSSTCTIDFADYIGLLILPDRAGYTFASNPFYIQGCGSGWVHVKENDVARYGANWGSAYGHYHLMYEKGSYCLPAGANYGYQMNFWFGSFCVPVADPAVEPRYLASHHGSQWIRVYAYKSGVSEMTFDFRSIRVKGTQGIKLYFRKANGSWLHWNDLGPGTWNTAPYAAGIREILIRASGNSPNSYSIDDIVVAVD